MAITDRVAALLEQVAADHATPSLPESTYRLQFHRGFTFRDATAIVPYLHDLGITHLYASPYLKARAGSQHGYDITDHHHLNPEVGDEGDYAGLVAALHERGMGQVLDTVPNHMGIAGNANAWWNDVLENGLSSPYACFFDIDWYSSLKAELREKVLLPVLGQPYGEVLHAGQLQLGYQAGAFTLHYFEHRFPISPCSYVRVLEHRLPELEHVLGKDALPFLEFQSIATGVRHLPSLTETDPERRQERLREKQVVKRRLAALTESCAEVRDFLAANLVVFNGTPGDARSFDLLDDLVNAQAYRLAFWRVAADEINYRRFFDINELAALNMERPEVLAETHRLIFRFLREGKVNGLRIDHPDGLYDPQQYLERLQEHFIAERARAKFDAEPDDGTRWEQLEEPLMQEIQARRRRGDWLQRPLYVVVEKILGKGEPLPEVWPVHGTTGYEFLNAVNGAFVDGSHATVFTRFYQQWTGMDPSVRPLVYESKRLIMQVALSSELHMLAHQLSRLAEKDRSSRDFTFNSLRHALREIIASFPVYRSYIRDAEVLPRDRVYVEKALLRARRQNAAISSNLFDFVQDMILLRCSELATPDYRAEQLRFVGKFQQVTSPVMAKGVEDTAFYVYNRLLSLNEVGGEPEQFGLLPSALHDANRDRQAHWPRALSTTATHDTKRGEDVRARLNVLSEVPVEWRKALTRWARINKRHLVSIEDGDVPDRNEEFLIYQTLVGAWPSGAMTGEALAEFRCRIQEYVQKAIHEAKSHTSWINPNPAYDEAMRKFVGNILDEKHGKRFLEDLPRFVERISNLGYCNSLGQTLLKIVSPGVPDTYQGTELWDLSLVDPDNRRPVDYAKRRAILADLQTRTQGDGPFDDLARELCATVQDGRIKLHVTWKSLTCRRTHPGLFAEGEYLPAEVLGSKADHVIALVRRLGMARAIAAVPRLVARLAPPTGLPLGEAVWLDTIVVLPGLAPGQQCRDEFTGALLTTFDHSGRAALRAADLFARFPVALLLTPH